MWERFNFRTGKLLTSGHTISFLRIFESCRLLWINPINGDASEITMWSVAGVATKLRMKAKIERRKIQPVHSKTLSFICTTVKLPLKSLFLFYEKTCFCGKVERCFRIKCRMRSLSPDFSQLWMALLNGEKRRKFQRRALGLISMFYF